MKDFKEITSKENSLIKLTSLLQSSAKARKENALFVLEGLWICFDAYDNGILFDKLIISHTAFEKYPDDIEKLRQFYFPTEPFELHIGEIEAALKDEEWR